MQYTQLSRRSAGGKIDWEKQYLTFIPVEDAVFTWAERATSGHLEYSLNGGQTWVTIADGESTLTITAGSKVLWRGDLVPATSSTTGGIGTFSASGNYNAFGNVQSLLYSDNFYHTNTKMQAAFRCLFYGDTHILSAPLLPATTIHVRCYQEMFRGCTSLTTAPEQLPATTLQSYCYINMFSDCTSLITAPELPATTLGQSCYQDMFNGCTSLTVAPELSATVLRTSCYQGMLRNCTSLATAPELPATTLARYCYSYMFQGCTSLTTAPELPATTLVDSCYQQMFYGCTQLNYIKCLATDISATYCTTKWLNNVAATGTFVKAASMEDWSTGASGIPSGWTVVDDTSFVDMGLPSGTLWATRNIDVTQPDGFAASPFQYECSFFSWGNIDGHNPISTSAFDYYWGTSNDGPYAQTSGSTLTGDIPVNDTYDAARANLGAPWRMPTRNDFAELFNNTKYINEDGTEIPSTTTNKLITVNGIVGVYLESKINGARLFFSCSGFGINRLWSAKGSFGDYWSSTLNSASYANRLVIGTNVINPQNILDRFYGFTIRPVMNKQN